MVGLETKKVHHLGDHLSVLTGQNHPSVQLRAGLKLLDHRSQLDGLRSRAEHDRHPGLASHTSLLVKRTLKVISACQNSNCGEAIDTNRRCCRDQSGFPTRVSATPTPT